MIETLSINSQPFLMNSDLEQGFLRGSIWNNLYEPYKYENTKSVFDNPSKQTDYLIMIYTFAKIDLSLYIITHPDEYEAIDTLKKIETELEKITEYQKQTDVSNLV